MIKSVVKKILASANLYNPAFGVKIGCKAKAENILAEKTEKLNVFVETGTRDGDMIEMVGGVFKKVYSIELDHDLYTKACARFAGRTDVVMLEGDSGVEIKKVLAELHEPALFWLDAHGLGDLNIKNHVHCPVEKELEAIFAHEVKSHTIMIDDVRHFDLSSIATIRKLAKKNGYSLIIKNGLFFMYGK